MAELNESEILKLIELYKCQENLYNSNLYVYHDRDKAKESLLYIGTEMGKGWTEQVTKLKLKWLRNGYTRNRNAVESSTKGGASTDDVFKVKWKWFQLLDTFLQPFCRVVVKGVSNLMNQTTQQSRSLSRPASDDSIFDTQPGDTLEDKHMEAPGDVSHNPGCEHDINQLIHSNLKHSPMKTQPFPDKTAEDVAASECASPAVRPPPPDFFRNKKQKTTDTGQALTILQDIAGQITGCLETKKTRRATQESNSKTDNDKFCMYVASQLDKLNYVNQLKTRKQISDILFQASLQELENNNTETSTPPPPLGL